MTTIREIQAFLQQKAPFETAEEWDNAGLLAGDPDTAVTGILLTLDITPQAVDFAADNGFGLIVSHHPVIFHPLRRLEPSGAPYALARRGVAALCAHTNLDKAPGGVNDTLAVLLGLRDVQATLVPDMQIIEKSTGETIAVTDAKGQFKFTTGNHEYLIFKKSGYQTVEIEVNNMNVINITVNYGEN